MRTRTGPTFAGTVCWIPAVSYVCLLSFATLAYFKVGHWPLYSQPDPKELRLPVLHGAALLAYPLTAMAIAAGFFGLIVAPHCWRRHQAAVLLFGAIAWGLSIRLTGGLIPWLID